MVACPLGFQLSQDVLPLQLLLPLAWRSSHSRGGCSRSRRCRSGLDKRLAAAGSAQAAQLARAPAVCRGGGAGCRLLCSGRQGQHGDGPCVLHLHRCCRLWQLKRCLRKKIGGSAGWQHGGRCGFLAGLQQLLLHLLLRTGLKQAAGGWSGFLCLRGRLLPRLCSLGASSLRHRRRRRRHFRRQLLCRGRCWRRGAGDALLQWF